MAVKTYVLLEHTKPTADIWRQINANQRVRLDQRLVDHAYLRMTFSDKMGKSHTYRLKLGCDSIDQNVQIKEFGILANVPFTPQEKEAVEFKWGSLTTATEVVQKYLESIPLFEPFWEKDKDGRVGTCTEVQRPLYKLYDPSVEIENDNKMFHTRLKAANKIAKMGLKEGQDTLIMIYGTHFKPPTTLKEVQNALVSFLDDVDEKGLNDFVKEDVTIDEEVTVLIGRATQAGIISFDAVENQVTKKVGGKDTKLIEISSSYEPEVRVQMFAEFLISNKGKLLYDDLEKDVKEIEKK